MVLFTQKKKSMMYSKKYHEENVYCPILVQMHLCVYIGRACDTNNTYINIWGVSACFFKQFWQAEIQTFSKQVCNDLGTKESATLKNLAKLELEELVSKV